MPLPKIKQFPFSFSFYFGNVIATNQLQQIFFFAILFLQCHYHKFIPTNFFPSILAHKSIATIFFPPISAMPLPQIYSHNFFSFYFGNAIVTNPLPQIFPPLFQQCITTNQLPLFFFFLRNDMCTLFFTTNPKW